MKLKISCDQSSLFITLEFYDAIFSIFFLKKRYSFRFAQTNPENKNQNAKM